MQLLKKVIGLAILAAAAVMLVACPAATPARDAPQAVDATVSRDDFGKFWNGYLPIFHRGRLHFSVIAGLKAGGQAHCGWYDVIDQANFRVSFIEGEGFIASIASYSIPLRGACNARTGVHVSSVYFSNNDLVLVSVPFSISATLPGFGSMTVEHNYRLEGNNLVFTILTSGFPKRS